MSGMELDNVADRKMGLTEILEEDKDGRTVNRDYSDNQDMHRLGKKQEFKRNFKFLSITCFTVVAQGGWVYAPYDATLVLANGNSGGVIVMQIVNYFGFFFIILSLAEMASIAPTAGGQYHWASESSPPRFQKFISYMAGWLSTLSWLTGTASGLFLAGVLIQGVAALTHPNYKAEPYQGYLLVVVVASISALLNSTLARYLPKLEGLVLIFMGLSFAAIMIVLWVLAPKLTASEVFSTFSNDAGWSSLGLSMMAGQSLLANLLIGSDSAAHMAEETMHASTVIPKAMVLSYLINGALVIIMMITFFFCLTDLSTALESPTGFPFIQVFVDATGSVGGGAAITCLFIIIIFFSVSNYMASCSRQVFAFARDQGLPCNKWIARVHPGTGFPLNAILLSFVFVVLISLITLGSSVAFNAIVSLFLLALMFTYMTSITCLVWRRLYGERLPPATWSLGRAGIWVNIMALTYCVYILIFIPWPTVTPVTLSTLNWAPVLFVGVMVGSLVYYVVYAHKVYEGPVTYVRKVY